MTGKLRQVLIMIMSITLMVAAAGGTPALAAPEPEFRLDMDKLNLQIGVSSNLTVSIENAQGAEIIVIAGIEDFDILSQNSSTSISIVNGQSTFKEERHYTIIPKTTGQFSLRAIIDFQDQVYETNTLYITVAEGSSSEDKAESELFVKTNLSKAEAYLGEKLVVTYELYTLYNIENFGFTDYTAIDGVIAKDVPPDQLKSELVYLDGVPYAKYEAKQLILDPIKSGSHTIPSFKMQVNVITNNNFGGGFGGFGGIFNSVQALYLQTQEKELTIKPLPAQGKPKDFSGIVGQLSIDGGYSREEVNYGDSLLATVTASGNCNLDSLKKVFTNPLNGFTLYETQKNTAESVADYQYYAQKDFEIILVPEKTGALEIAPLTVSYFDPESEKYLQAELAGLTVAVRGDISAQPSNFGSGQAASMETIKISQVNYAQAKNGYFTINVNKQVLYMVLTGLAVLLVLAAALILLLKKRRQQDVVMKSLYRQLLATNDINEAYNLFGGMIKHRYNLSIKASSKNTILNSLPQADLALQVADIMEYMESGGEKTCSCLIDKIKGVYRAL